MLRLAPENQLKEPIQPYSTSEVLSDLREMHAKTDTVSAHLIGLVKGLWIVPVSKLSCLKIYGEGLESRKRRSS